MTYLTDWSLSTLTESQSQSQSRTSHTSHFPTTITSTSTSMLQALSSTPTPQQHKTNFCYAYQNGSCQRGDSCKYRHESPHMTSASPSPSHTRGASVPILQHHSTDHNGYSHFPNTTSTNTNTNTSISASFEQRNNNNGYNMHQDRKLEVPQQRDTYTDPIPRTTTPPVHVQQHNNGGVMLNVPHGACRQWYMRGRCDYGTNCKYQHIHNTGNNHTNNNNNNHNHNNNNNGHQQQHHQQQQQHQQHHTSHHHTNSYTNGEMNGLLDSTQSKPLYNRASSLDLNGNSYHHNNNNNQYHTQHNNNSGNGLLQTNGQQQQQHNVCHYYARTGKCKYGGSCKFSHDSHHQQHQQHQQHQPQQHNMHNNNNNNTNNNSPIFSTHPTPQQHNNHTFGLNGHNTMNGYAQPFQPQQTSHQHSHSMSALNGHHQQHHQQHQHHHPSSSHDFLSMPSINKFPSVDMPDTTITTGHTNPLSTLSLNPNPDVFPSAPSSFLRLHSNVPMMDANERDIMNDEYIPLQTPAQSSLSSVFGGFTSQQNNNNNAFASPFPSSLSLSLKPSVPLFGSSSTSSSSLLSTPSSALSLSSSSSAASSTASSPVHSHYRADLRCDKCSNLGTVYNKTVPSTNQPISGWYTPSTTMISLCWRCCSCLHCGNAKPISSLGLCAVCNPLQA